MEIKKAKTFQEQIKRLQEHGCIIDDEAEAVSILNRVNYYKLSAYFLPFKNDDGNYHKITLVKIYKTYEFERKLINLLYGVIQTIEVFLKTQIAYYHSNAYGALGYLDISNMNNDFAEKHAELISDFNMEVKRNRRLQFVRHHIENYDGKFPLWVAVELFTLGNLSQFYSQMKTSDQKAIAKKISTITGVGSTYSILKSCLKCLTELRNTCAHFSRVYYTRFISVPKLAKPYLSKFAGNTTPANMYSYMFVLKMLYPMPNKWKNIITDIYNLIDKPVTVCQDLF